MAGAIAATVAGAEDVATITAGAPLAVSPPSTAAMAMKRCLLVMTGPFP